MIRSIRTTYRGVTFESTLEADWAKNLDKFRIPWQYEPEGVRLPSGVNYRCDLFLPSTSTWLEVKGPHNQRIEKPGMLADAVVHAPGCERGEPVRVLAGGLSGCACRFGPSVPYQLVVVGKAAMSGRLTFEAAHGSVIEGQEIVLLQCPSCQQHSFTDMRMPLCRRCLRVGTGGLAFPSRALPFERIVPPRGRRRPAS